MKEIDCCRVKSANSHEQFMKHRIKMIYRFYYILNDLSPNHKTKWIITKGIVKSDHDRAIGIFDM